jgi:hypothetical protein
MELSHRNLSARSWIMPDFVIAFALAEKSPASFVKKFFVNGVKLFTKLLTRRATDSPECKKNA